MKPRILVPTDYSPGSLHALERAMDLAARLGAEVDLLHVLDVPGGDPKNDLRHFASLIERKKGRPVNLRIESGEPAPCIARIADEGDYAMIVIGTHGRHGVERALLGSVAEELVRMSRVPVLTIHLSMESSTRPRPRPGRRV